MSLSLAAPHNMIDRISFSSSEDAVVLASAAGDSQPEIVREREPAQQATTPRPRPSLMTALLQAFATPWAC